MTDRATLYHEAASASGAWCARLRPFQDALVDHAAKRLLSVCAVDVPLNAAVMADGDVVRTRHPSVTHGTPGVKLCADETRYVAASLGWQLLPPVPRQLVVPMGLREGYSPDSPVSTPDTVSERLAGARSASHAARLVSASWVDGRLRTYSEPGVVIVSNHDDLDAITKVAHSLGQQQICVTDFAADRTYTLHHS